MAMDDAERARIIQAIRAYIAKERISREEFAQRAKLGKSTVDKLVTGIFSDKTILQIEAQLNIDLRRSDDEGRAEFAKEEFGKYTREDTKNYLGQYVFARPSFQEAGVIHAFHMDISWDQTEKVLLVKENAPHKKHPAQFGKIYIPRASMHLFILSNERGWLKSVILSQLDVYKRMKGMMLTMGNAFANVYSPIAMPVILNKYDRIDKSMLGKLLPGSAAYEEYKKDLQAVEASQYAKWIRVE
jgi:transcriptional regulator with XRE-family HTH domain